METNDKRMTWVNGMAPVIPVHPGGILGEELKARGILQKDFARQIGMQAPHLSALIHGARNFTPEIAAKVASGLQDISADFWMKAQAKYQQDKNRRQRRLSDFVDGYGFRSRTVPSSLHDTGSEGFAWSQFIISVPDTDAEIFRLVADRMGWLVEQSGEG